MTMDPDGVADEDVQDPGAGLRAVTAPTPVPRGGRAVSWISFVFGSVVSTAGNVLYTWIPPAGARADWHPTIVAQLFAAVWPIALLLSVEVLSRARWAPGWQWRAARYGGAGTVAVGSAVISYGHLHAVLDSWGYGLLGAGFGPLVLDGLMVVSGFALLSPVPAVPTGRPAGMPGQVPEGARSDQPKHQAVVNDDDVLQWLREEAGRTGKVPGRKAIVDRFGVGSTRADNLRAQVDVPARMRRVK